MPSIGSSFACKTVEGRSQSEIVFPHSMAHLEFRVQRREGPIEVRPRAYLSSVLSWSNAIIFTTE